MAHFAGLDVSVKETSVCVETRHMKALLMAQQIKSPIPMMPAASRR